MTAVVFALEATHEKSWWNILDVLTLNINQQDFEIKKTALTTLGYICEYLKEDKVTDMPDDSIETLISGIFLGL